jgi:hypothetical protein
MDGVKKVRLLRKERARILTVLKQKGVAPSAAAAAPAPLVTKTAGKAAAKAAPKAAPRKAVSKKAVANKAGMSGKKGK